MVEVFTQPGGLRPLPECDANPGAHFVSVERLGDIVGSAQVQRRPHARADCTASNSSTLASIVVATRH